MGVSRVNHSHRDLVLLRVLERASLDDHTGGAQQVENATTLRDALNACERIHAVPLKLHVLVQVLSVDAQSEIDGWVYDLVSSVYLCH